MWRGCLNALLCLWCCSLFTAAAEPRYAVAEREDEDIKLEF